MDYSEGRSQVSEKAGGHVPTSELLDKLGLKAELSGLKIYKKDRIEITPKADGVMHDSMEGWWQSIVYKEKMRSWPASRKDKPIIHQSVIDRAEKIKEYNPWILNIDHEIEVMESIDWNDSQ